MEGFEETERLLQLEFDIQHINVLSRKNKKEHAVVRLIISSLATPEEITNLTKDNIGTKPQKPTISLNSPNGGRVSPIDERTFNILNDLTREKEKKEEIFPFTEEDLDKIVNKYAPSRTKYHVKKLRKAVVEILQDCQLFGDKDYVNELVKGKDQSGVVDFLHDFHPLYTGTWDIDNDDVAREFILSYSSYNDTFDPEKIAEETGESEERVSRLLE